MQAIKRRPKFGMKKNIHGLHPRRIEDLLAREGGQQGGHAWTFILNLKAGQADGRPTHLFLNELRCPESVMRPGIPSPPAGLRDKSR